MLLLILDHEPLYTFPLLVAACCNHEQKTSYLSLTETEIQTQRMTLQVFSFSRGLVLNILLSMLSSLLPLVQIFNICPLNFKSLSVFTHKSLTLLDSHIFSLPMSVHESPCLFPGMLIFRGSIKWMMCSV